MKEIVEHPILFSTPMVRAILDGRKAQTRRVIRFPKAFFEQDEEVFCLSQTFDETVLFGDSPNIQECFGKCEIRNPYGVPGHHLWVRETWSCWQQKETLKWKPKYFYKADGTELPDKKFFQWKPSIHMPRIASRITLEVTDIRVERLQDITDEDAKAEGITERTTELKSPSQRFLMKNGTGWALTSAQNEYAYLWDKINAKRGFEWETNPFVFVITFKRLASEVKE